MDGVVAVYTDGGLCDANQKDIGSVEGGVWAWCGVDAKGERIVEKYGYVTPDSRYEETAQGITNNQAEFYAVCKALRDLPDGWSGKLFTDSMTVVYRFRSAGRKKQKLMKHTPLIWQDWFWRRLKQLGKIEVVCLKGHPTEVELAQGWGWNSQGMDRVPVSVHNEWCDEACRKLVLRYWLTEREAA